MNERFLPLLSLAFLSCMMISRPLRAALHSFNDTLKVNLATSKIDWKGTKMFGAGKHEGEVPLLNGYVIVKKNTLIGGRFTIDMKNLTVTDIPKTDPIPIRNLNTHLKSKDFFDVQTFPTASLILDKIKQSGKDSLDISAHLTMRGVTQSIQFKVSKNATRYTAHFIIDRFRWNVGYTGSWADRTLVDKDIDLKITIATN
ncbi:YceI family protein [Dyadobacter arcticus]|uniref:Polyisoprenoid-binding protein YceI n=1 Tax=Dyadobacter arcticus TaxID=1078754 RepID=A0ABX0UHK0_9BACT|nr:YceI family protein [Dyadobacter arcticus]NIJ52486.1 polyisoprenoid-binding protein YceI [Dyadobacter arcticus]